MKKYEKPFVMKLEIDNDKVLTESTPSICDEDEVNKFIGSKKNNGCDSVTIGYAADGVITWI